jgi:hypothetical protein
VDVSNNEISADKLQEIDQTVCSNRLRLIHEDNNKSLSEIDLSSRCLDAKDAIVVAEYIKDNGVLTKLTFGDTQVVTMTTEMTEANFSGKLKSYEAQIVAAFLPKCTYVPEYPLLTLADTPPTTGP